MLWYICWPGDVLAIYRLGVVCYGIYVGLKMPVLLTSKIRLAAL